MPTLVSITSAGVGRKYRVSEECVIGRHSDCDIQIIDAQLSKQHAKLTVQGEETLLADLGSTNGTYLNGERVSAPRNLRPNDVVSIGSQAFLFAPDFEVLPAEDGHAVLIVDHDAGTPSATRPLVAARDLKTALVSELLSVLTGELSAEAGAPELMSALGKHLPYDAAALLAGHDENAEALFVQSRRSTLSVPRSIVALALRDRRALRIDDAVGDTHFSQGKSVVSGQLRSVLACPLAVGNVLVGAVFMTKDQPRFYDDAALDRLVEAAPLLAVAVAQTRRMQKLVRRVQSSREPAPILLGDSALMQALRREMAKAAEVDAPALIHGETGTGKEIVARALHTSGPRAAGAFVAVNCGALPEPLVESELFGHEKGAFSGADAAKPGHLELAGGGTLFLDEIGELPLAVQVKLLRVLQEKSFYRLGGVKPVHADFRLVAATHRDLEAAVSQGSFRQDLYYRLNVLRLEVPPLRARAEDIPQLAAHFVQVLGQELGRAGAAVSATAMEKLTHYAWPGNVRELRNVIERGLALADDAQGALDIADLPAEVLGPPPAVDEAGSLPARVAALERDLIVEALKAARGKKLHASAALGISRPTLDRKIRAYGIDIFAEDG